MYPEISTASGFTSPLTFGMNVVDHGDEQTVAKEASTKVSKSIRAHVVGRDLKAMFVEERNGTSGIHRGF